MVWAVVSGWTRRTLWPRRKKRKRKRVKKKSMKNQEELVEEVVFSWRWEGPERTLREQQCWLGFLLPEGQRRPSQEAARGQSQSDTLVLSKVFSDRASLSLLGLDLLLGKASLQSKKKTEEMKRRMKKTRKSHQLERLSSRGQ